MRANAKPRLLAEFPPVSYDDWRKLVEVELKGAPFDKKMLSATYEGMTLEDAYAVQLHQVKSLTDAGRIVRGHKVGLTNARVQQQLGVDQPDYGHLYDDFFYLEHMPIPMGRFLQPRVEPEIAFVLGKPLRGPGVTVRRPSSTACASALEWSPRWCGTSSSLSLLATAVPFMGPSCSTIATQ